jgi:hypothetical protein
MIEGRVNRLEMEVDQIRASLGGEAMQIQAATFHLPLEVVETWAIKQHVRVVCLKGGGWYCANARATVGQRP